MGVLRATRPLLDDDHDWILPNIALLEGQLPVYDTLIDRLNTAVEELETYRATIQRVSKEFSSTLAPIRHLPSDVLRSIFRETQSQNPVGQSLYYHRPTIRFMHGTLTLGQVCASWRDIVVSSPELWSHIRITFPSFTVDNTALSPLLKAILPLSGQLPLEIRFISDRNTTTDKAIEAFSLLLGERRRWRSASLKLSFDSLQQLRASNGKLAYLESLILMTPNPPMETRVFPPGDVSDVFIDAPSLRKVVLHEVECGSFAFPSQLTHLAASFTAIHNLHTLSLLEELHLGERHDDIAFHHRITLPKVRRLSVSSLKMLRHLCLPSLENLTFDHYSSNEPPNFYAHLNEDATAASTLAISDFIRSSHCSLTSLATTSSIIYASNFTREALPLLESLTSLEFQIIQFYERRFYYTLMSPNVLPNLQYLTMRLPSMRMEDVSQDTLSAMLASRGQHLLSVRIDCPIMPNNRHVDVLNTLEPLRQLGVDLRTVAMDSDSIGIEFGKFA